MYASTEGPYGTNVHIVRPDGQDKIDVTPGTHSHDFDPAWQPLCIVRGSASADVLRGTVLDELVCGFAGNDTIRGGAGRDKPHGGDDNDVIRARDGSFDLVGVDCERIRRG